MEAKSISSISSSGSSGGGRFSIESLRGIRLDVAILQKIGLTFIQLKALDIYKSGTFSTADLSGNEILPNSQKCRYGELLSEISPKDG